VVRTPKKDKEDLPPMAKSQENGTTILLGLKGYEVVIVTESEGKIYITH
jgi:hypothetical protein